MEEDIKILEEMITWDCLLPNKRQTEAIENLIKGYRELEEGNKELKRLANNKQWISPCYVAQNYIPKSKIKEKIEELKKRKEKCEHIESEIRLDVKIRAYEELMEDK